VALTTHCLQMSLDSGKQEAMLVLRAAAFQLSATYAHSFAFRIVSLWLATSANVCTDSSASSETLSESFASSETLRTVGVGP